MPETDPTEPLPTEPAPFVEVFDGFEMADDDRDNGYPGPCNEPDYQGIIERRAEFRGRFWQEP